MSHHSSRRIYRFRKTLAVASKRTFLRLLPQALALTHKLWDSAARADVKYHLRRDSLYNPSSTSSTTKTAETVYINCVPNEGAPACSTVLGIVVLLWPSHGSLKF